MALVGAPIIQNTWRFVIIIGLQKSGIVAFERMDEAKIVNRRVEVNWYGEQRRLLNGGYPLRVFFGTIRLRHRLIAFRDGLGIWLFAVLTVVFLPYALSFNTVPFDEENILHRAQTSGAAPSLSSTGVKHQVNRLTPTIRIRTFYILKVRLTRFAESAPFSFRFSYHSCLPETDLALSGNVRKSQAQKRPPTNQDGIRAQRLS